MNAISNRQHYVSDQGVRITRLPLLVLGGLFAATAVGWLLQFLFFQGWYFVIIVPVFGGALLASVLTWLVGWAHCRNRWVAGTLGAIAGSLAYLSYFYFCMIHQAPQATGRLDLLPSYIVFRMQSDVVEDLGKPKNNNRPP